MDTRFKPLGFSLNVPSPSACQGRSRVQPGDEHCTDTTLQLVSPARSTLYGPVLKGTKRTWADIDKLQGLNHSSLALGLGQSSKSSDSSKRSSSTVRTMSSAKEIDKESSVDLGLSFQRHLGSESTTPQDPVATPKALDNGPMLDLGLSLSVWPSESVVSNVSTLPACYHNSIATSVAAKPGLTLEEGSTSSGCTYASHILPYKYTSHILPYKYTSESASCFPSNQESCGRTPNPDLLTTVLPMPISPIACTSVVSQQQQRNTNMKKCQFQGCGKGARGGSGLCIAHGGGKRCQKVGCQKGADGGTIYCKAHGGGRRCDSFGCTKSAEGRTNYCIAHGGGRRCSHEGCTKSARGKSGLCIRHGGGKRCKKENCTKSAEGYSGLCISHGGGRRCQYPECSKGAQGGTMLCKAHGGGKRCTYLGCIKGAEGSTPFCKGHGGGKRCTFEGGCTKSVHGGTLFCVAHGGGKRCAVPECTKSARGRTSFCVCHGGGKRCKFEGCGKSAQGRTDFCKAHGGGKRCSWGQDGSDIGAGEPPCYRYARSKIGLCAAHNSLVQDQCVHGGAMLEQVSSEHLTPSKPEKMKGVDYSEDFGWNTKFQPGLLSLPEGRVHGGGLMTLLGSSGSTGSYPGIRIRGETSEQ